MTGLYCGRNRTQICDDTADVGHPSWAGGLLLAGYCHVGHAVKLMEGGKVEVQREWVTHRLGVSCTAIYEIWSPWPASMQLPGMTLSVHFGLL